MSVRRPFSHKFLSRQANLSLDGRLGHTGEEGERGGHSGLNLGVRPCNKIPHLNVKNKDETAPPMLPVYGEICQRMGGTKVKPFFAWGGEVWLWLEENLCLYIFKCFFMVICIFEQKS